MVDPRECCKYFEPGQRVKVISHHAKQRGRIGDVIKADTDAQTVIVAFASLGMDGWPEEVHLPINDVKVTFELSNANMSGSGRMQLVMRISQHSKISHA